MRRGWIRWLQAAVGLAIVVYAVRLLVRNWDAIRTARLDWHVRPLPVIASVLLILVTYGLLTEAWRRMVAGWARRLRWVEAARIWVLSSMGKYLPGKLWAIAGLAILGQRAGVPPGVATASAVALQILSIGAGALVIGIFGFGDLERVRPGTGLALLALIGLAGAAILVIARPAPLNRLLARTLGEDKAVLAAPPAATLAFGAIANTLAWLGYGLSLYWLARGTLEGSSLDLRTAVVAFTGSYLAGYLFLLVPSGLGVRESVLVLLTQSSVGPVQALALAALSRVSMTVADLIAAAPFLLFRGTPRA